MTAPQSVTERYVSNLLHYGQNKEFLLVKLECKDNIVDDQHCGFYFRADVAPTTEPFTGKIGSGATLSQAVRRALEKHGVTFR